VAFRLFLNLAVAVAGGGRLLRFPLGRRHLAGGRAGRFLRFLQGGKAGGDGLDDAGDLDHAILGRPDLGAGFAGDVEGFAGELLGDLGGLDGIGRDFLGLLRGRGGDAGGERGVCAF
jgi:hypothetical protein